MLETADVISDDVDRDHERDAGRNRRRSAISVKRDPRLSFLITSKSCRGSKKRFRSRRSIGHPLASSGRDFISLAAFSFRASEEQKESRSMPPARAAARAPGRKAGAFCSPLLKVDADAAINMTPV